MAAIFYRGQEPEDWTADYRVFSRSPWKAEDLFGPIYTHGLSEYDGARPIASASTTPLCLGPERRFLPPSGSGIRRARLFTLISFGPQKPGRKATEEQLKAYRQLRREKNLSSCFVDMVKELRRGLDEQGDAKRLMLAVGDSYCHKRTFTHSNNLWTEVLSQTYFDRWAIEVKHHDVLVAGLNAYRPKRTSEYGVLPKRSRGAKRPPCSDLLTLLRKQLLAQETADGAVPASDYETMVLTAAA